MEEQCSRGRREVFMAVLKKVMIGVVIAIVVYGLTMGALYGYFMRAASMLLVSGVAIVFLYWKWRLIVGWAFLIFVAWMGITYLG
ncbi:hypothetical protein HCA69_16010 [Listeria grandensis]|uniref:Uncharacterized protein n=1 Tax=Listeria grandensis TaxID=1494963 RepID=A0A7X1CR95_9LIST|nr:hypothetical protein [Listeria grandensis]MBC1937868.1 hypothetical protein [Listeria grandensis]